MDRKHGSLENAGVAHEVMKLSMELKCSDLLSSGGKEKLAPGGGNWFCCGLEDMSRSGDRNKKFSYCFWDSKSHVRIHEVLEPPATLQQLHRDQ